jgi:glycosyltransferase involved in cell wall biosynthesis
LIVLVGILGELLKKIKISIISPKFHPLEDGLGQYVKWFYLNLKEKADVNVITSTDNNLPQEDVEFSQIHRVIDGWKFPKLWKLKDVINKVDPDIILFQYVPFMYSKRGGINFSIVFFMLYLRIFTNRQIHIMYHELHYPSQLNIKAQIMFFSHCLMLYISSLSAHHIFCSARFYRDRINSMLLYLKTNITHLPVGSNIDYKKFDKIELYELRKSIASDGVTLLGCFGSFHPSKNYPMIIQSLHNAQKNSKLKIKLLFIGATKINILDQLPQTLREEVKDMIHGTGFLSQVDVAKNLQVLDGFIGYFSDGVTTRRGSLIAALQNGVPVLTTKSNRTEKLFEGRDYIRLLSTGENDFNKELEHELSSGWPANAKDTAKRDIFFSEYFSWNSIINKYLKELK